MVNITLDNKEVECIITGLKAAIATFESTAWYYSAGSEREIDMLLERDKLAKTLERIKAHSGK